MFTSFSSLASLNCEYAISVSSLSKNFGKIRAVDGISFEVEKGELFGFLGPNGAGKTTTQRMLTGILKPNSGAIHIMGFDLFKNPSDAKMFMGVVPEMANPYIDLSAWDNLMLMGELYGVPKKKRKQKALELLELFSLQDRKDQKTGMFQIPEKISLHFLLTDLFLSLRRITDSNFIIYPLAQNPLAKNCQHIFETCLIIGIAIHKRSMPKRLS